MEAIRKVALADKVVASDYIETLREQVAEIPALREVQSAFINQTEALIASVQAQSADLVALIDTVQSGHFWTLKRLASRARARFFRR